ncbi:conserved hypothetical protein [Frankia canadensis]|uniref:Uncharacterized protein n=1 Tax=Frankia canadensis TaxID=1836972 RepID=A0A2I2L090_9ACTN|nr:conserved hypothetical protein [Frankia canadensis]SOU58642.1 conserved hypothetical protein [Frankia canadensis]
MRGRSGQRRDGRRDAVGYGCVVGLHLSQINEADELLTNDPLALLIGMVLDQPVSEGWSGMGQSVLA